MYDGTTCSALWLLVLAIMLSESTQTVLLATRWYQTILTISFLKYRIYLYLTIKSSLHLDNNHSRQQSKNTENEIHTIARIISSPIKASMIPSFAFNNSKNILCGLLPVIHTHDSIEYWPDLVMLNIVQSLVYVSSTIVHIIFKMHCIFLAEIIISIQFYPC